MANCTRNSVPYSWGHTFDHLLKKRIIGDFVDDVQPIELNNRIYHRKAALSETEESNLKAIRISKGRREANIYLLDVLVQKEDWLPNLLKALQHPDIGLEFLAKKIVDAKEYLINHPEESSEDSASEEQRQSNKTDQTHRRTLVKTLSLNTGAKQEDEVDGQSDSESVPAQGQDRSTRSMSGPPSQQCAQAEVEPSYQRYPDPGSSTETECHLYDSPDYITQYDVIDDEVRYDNKEYLLYDDWAPAEEEDDYNDAKSLGPPNHLNPTTPNLQTPVTTHGAFAAVPPKHNSSFNDRATSKRKTVSFMASNTSSSPTSSPPRRNDSTITGRQQVHTTNHTNRPTPCRNSASLSGNWSSPDSHNRRKETQPGSLAAHRRRARESGSAGDSPVGYKQEDIHRRKQDDRVPESSRESNSEQSYTSRKSGLTLSDLHTCEKGGHRHTDPENYFTREEVDKELSPVPGYIPNVTDDQLDVRLSNVEEGTYVLWYYEQKRRPALTVMYGGKPTTFLLKKRSGHAGLKYNIFEDQFEAFSLRELITHHLTSGIKYVHRQIISLQVPLR